MWDTASLAACRVLRVVIKCVLHGPTSPDYIIRSRVQSSTGDHRKNELGPGRGAARRAQRQVRYIDYALRSTTQSRFIVLQTKIKFGERLFAVAGPTVWNSLPDFVKYSCSIGIIDTMTTI